MHFTLCGIPMRLECGTESVERRVMGIFRSLFAISPASGLSDFLPGSGIEFRIVEADQVPVAVEGTYDFTGLCPINTAQGCNLHTEKAFLSLDLNAGRAEGTFSSAFLSSGLEEQRGFLLIALLMLLSGRGIYPLHAGAVVSPKGEGVLLAGVSGSGKTTLTCALTRSGWSYLSDDSLLLKSTPAGVEALAFARSFHCSAEMFGHFPELRSQADAPEYGKRLVEVEALYPGRNIRQMSAKTILFPTIVAGPVSRVIPLSKTETLVHLLRSGAARLHSRETMAAQMAVLTQLAQTAHGFRLLHGADVHRNPQRVAALIEQLTRSEGGRNELSSAA